MLGLIAVGAVSVAIGGLQAAVPQWFVRALRYRTNQRVTPEQAIGLLRMTGVFAVVFGLVLIYLGYVNS